MNSIDTDKIGQHVEEHGYAVIVEFTCREADETYLSLADVYPEANGYLDVQSINECPYCGKRHFPTIKP